jgi:hypothetical protein
MRIFSVIRCSIVHLLAIAIVIAPALLPGPAEAAEIGLSFTEGVTTEDKDTARKALAETMKYFETNYQLSLKYPLQIILVGRNKDFANALTRHCVISTEEAKELDKYVGGFSCAKDGVEKVLMRMANRPKAQWIRLQCHEIVHKFERQEALAGSHNGIMWLCEGVADVIGAFVAESCGAGPVRLDRQNTCLKGIRAAKKFPSLTSLHSTKEWAAAGKKYGLGYEYITAELAVFELAKLKGDKSLFQYFINLKRYNNAQAFEMAFGMKLSDYEKYFDQLLAEKMLPEPVKIRFTRAQDGVISDNATGLEWYAGSDKDTNWHQAKSWTESLTAAGGGWRMPTVPELTGLYQKGAAPNNIDPIFQTTGGWVWSGQMVDPSSARGFNFLPGTECYPGLDHGSKGRAFAVRSRR